jgi:hypothetical protein
MIHTTKKNPLVVTPHPATSPSFKLKNTTPLPTPLAPERFPFLQTISFPQTFPFRHHFIVQSIPVPSSTLSKPSNSFMPTSLPLPSCPADPLRNPDIKFLFLQRTHSASSRFPREKSGTMPSLDSCSYTVRLTQTRVGKKKRTSVITPHATCRCFVDENSNSA